MESIDGYPRPVSTRGKALGIALIVIVGLLNFHLPHFLLERSPAAGDTGYLEVVFLANLLGAVIAASLILEALFVLLARSQIVSSRLRKGG